VNVFGSALMAKLCHFFEIWPLRPSARSAAPRIDKTIHLIVSIEKTIHFASFIN